MNDRESEVEKLARDVRGYLGWAVGLAVGSVAVVLLSIVAFLVLLALGPTCGPG